MGTNQRSQFLVALAIASATASASTKISTLALAISASTISALQYFDSKPSHFHENCNKHQFWRVSQCPQTSVTWMLCPFVHFFLDRQKVSLKFTAFLPSLRCITGWHFSAKVSTKVVRKNWHFSAKRYVTIVTHRVTIVTPCHNCDAPGNPSIDFVKHPHLPYYTFFWMINMSIIAVTPHILRNITSI